MEGAEQQVDDGAAVGGAELLACDVVLAPRVDVQDVERREVGVEELGAVELARADDRVDRPALADVDVRFQVQEVDFGRIRVFAVPDLYPVLHRDPPRRLFHVVAPGDRVRVALEPGEIEPEALVGPRSQREQNAGRLDVRAVPVVRAVHDVRDGAADVAVFVDDTRGENVVDELYVLHELDALRIQTAALDPDAPVVAVELGPVVVDEDRPDQGVRTLHGRLGPAEDLHRLGVEQRRVQMVARPRCERQLIDEDGGERSAVRVVGLQTAVVHPADRVATLLRRADVDVRGAVEGILDGDDRIRVDAVGAQMGDADAELLPAGAELAADDGDFLDETPDFQADIQVRAAGAGDRHAVPVQGVEAIQTEGNRVLPGRQTVDDEASLRVRRRVARAAVKGGACRLHGDARQGRAGRVRHGARDVAVLRKRRKRQEKKKGGQKRVPDSKKVHGWKVLWLSMRVDGCEVGWAVASERRRKCTEQVRCTRSDAPRSAPVAAALGTPLSRCGRGRVQTVSGDTYPSRAGRGVAGGVRRRLRPRAVRGQSAVGARCSRTRLHAQASAWPRGGPGASRPSPCRPGSSSRGRVGRGCRNDRAAARPGLR